MTQYLEEAAALLRKASETNAERRRMGAYRHLSEVIEVDQRIAGQFAQLAAIEKGLVPAEMVGELLARVARSETGR